MNPRTSLFQNISPQVSHWIGAGSGVRGLTFNFAASKSYARAELYIDRGDREENKFVFDEVFKIKDEIERDFGEPLVWERLDDKRGSRIKSEIEGNIFEEASWGELIPSMVDRMVRLERSQMEVGNCES